MKLFFIYRLVVFFMIVGLFFLFYSFCLVAEEAGNISFDGIITGNYVNVRVNGTISSEVICQLNEGDRVNVVGEKDKWYKVELPRKTPVYIHKSNVAKKGDVFVVNDDNSKIRLAATESSGVVGRIKKDISLNILKEYLDWYEIEAPKGNYGWIFSSYVHRKDDSVLHSTVSFGATLAQLREAYLAELKKPLREIELGWLLDEYEGLAKENKNSAGVDELISRIEEVKLKVAEIDYMRAKDEYEAKLKNISSPRPGEEPLTAGTVSNVGKIPNRLSRFKLIDDRGLLVGYITSKKVDFNKYVNIKVRLWGVKKDFKNALLFDVDALEVIQ